MEPLLRQLQQHRRTLARVVLVVGTLLVARQLWPAISRDTVVELELGPDHAQVVEVRLTYLLEGEELHGVNFLFESGAPARVKHRVGLPSGDLELHCALRGRDGVLREYTRWLHVPAEGVVRISLAGMA